MASVGKWKVPISPDTSGFKGVGKEIEAALSGAGGGAGAKLGKSLADGIDPKAFDKVGDGIDDALKDAAKDSRKIGEQIGDEVASGADSKWSKLGDGAKSALVGVGKVAIGAAAAGGAALVGLAAASVASYADYEQFVGGVDKLFGDASSTVQANAAKAFQTAGLSANDYLETVTSFSASLIGGLNGDTAEAARLSDMAITDMADNANTFGTSMETLQTTYNGFAKGNFAMLDNLKLGYGGTAAEMARLINDSGVMGDSFVATAANMKDIPFDKMIEGINQIQSGMDITGTTAKEGSATIAGSLSQVTSGWQNVVTGFAVGGDFLDSALEGFATSVGSFANNVIAILPQVIAGITTAVTTLIPTLMELIVQIIPELANLLVTGLPALVSAIVTALPGLIEVLIQAVIALFPVFLELVVDLALALVNALPALITSLVGFLVGAIPQLVTAAIQLLMGILMALPVIIVALVEALPQLIGSLIAALLAAIPQLIMAAIQLFMALVTALPQIIPALINQLPSLISSVVNGLIAAAPQLAAAGLDMMRGLANGLANFDFMGVIRGIGDSILNGFKSFFGIKSPSLLMNKLIGSQIGAGVAVGIEDSASIVDAAVNGLSSDISMGFDVNAGSLGTMGAGGGAGGGITVNQTVDAPKSKLDIELNTRKGVALGLATARG